MLRTYLAFLLVLLVSQKQFAQTCDCNPNSCNITATISYDNNYASGDYSIFYGGTDEVLDRPFIIVEGLDIYNEIGCAEFSSGVPSLISGLRTAGYDIVFLNFSNNTDYIQKNAFLLVKLIQTINLNKTGTNKSIVAGLNVGAVIARYALTYMEENSIDHETMCYLSIDGTHRGFNIPIGLQMWLQGLTNDPILLGDILPIYWALNTPLMKQLLICAASPTVNAQYPVPYAEYNSFFSELRGMNSCYGYPKRCKKIAISNGSIYGDVQKKIDNTDAVSGDFFFTYSNADEFEDNGWLFVNPEGLLLTSGWVRSVFDQDVATTYAEEEFLLATCYHHDFVVTFNWSPSPPTLNHLRPYDICPGSYGSLVQKSYETISEYLGYTNIQRYFTRATFIPTISALDINTNDFFFDFTSNLPIETVSPFDKCLYNNSNGSAESISFNPTILANLVSEISTASNYLLCTEENIIVPTLTIAASDIDQQIASNTVIVSDYVLESNAKTYIRANNTVYVENGFIAKSGGEGIINIGTCNYNICVPPAMKVDDKETSNQKQDNQNGKGIKETHFSIYPNPTSSILKVTTGEESTTGIVSIKNEHGQIIAELDVHTPNFEVDLSSYNSGVYLLTYKSLQQHVTKKILLIK